MRIEQLRVQGYRSLYDLQFKPRPFTVLVGPNNAGKSNLVDAFAFLADVYRDGIERATDRRGGLEEIPFQRQRAPWLPITFDIDVTVPLNEIPDYRSAIRDKSVAHASAPDPLGTTAFLRHTLTLLVSGRPIVVDSGIQTETLTAGIVMDGER